VRELGFMGSTLAGTDLPPSAVHALIEIGDRHVDTAAELCSVLNLEKSSVSRMLNKLIKTGELVTQPSERDAREKLLRLTEKGQQTLAGINRFAEHQVLNALAKLPAGASADIADGLQHYAAALRAHRLVKHQLLLRLLRLLAVICRDSSAGRSKCTCNIIHVPWALVPSLKLPSVRCCPNSRTGYHIHRIKPGPQ
jgi:DNA-binding MarR family transcriptional regulator